MKTDSASIQATLRQLLSNIAPDADLAALGENEDIRQTLGIDSFDFLNFMIAINESFGVEIPETDYGQLVTLTDVQQYIKNHLH